MVQEPQDRNPPPARLALRVGVTGHRLDGLRELGADEALLRATLRRVLQQVGAIVADVAVSAGAAYAKGPPILRLVSPLAEGADRWAAQEGRALGFELQAPLPFTRDEYQNDFTSEASREEFRALLTEASAVLELDGSRAKENEAYEEVGRVVLRQCDLLLAVWDGEDLHGRGGTGQMVQEAREKALPVVWVDARPPHSVRPLHVQPGATPAQVFEDVEAQLRAALAPPLEEAPPAQGAGPRRRERHRNDNGNGLESYHRETRRAWRPGLFFGGFVRLAAGKSPTESTASPSLPAGSLDRHYDWADHLADHYAGLYRSSFLLNYLLGASAVLVAISGHMLHQHHWQSLALLFAVIELAFILAILGITFTGRRRRWHARWMDYRLLAEQLRQMRFLAPLGRSLPASMPPPAHMAHGDPRGTWVAWYFRALVRASPLAAGVMDAAYLDSHRELLARSLREQVEYHRRSAERSERLHRRLHWIGQGFFFITLLACVGHLLHLLAGSGVAEAGGWLGVLILYSVVVLPAFGAAFAAILNQGEFERLALRSHAMQAKLEEIAGTLDQTKEESRRLGEISEAAAEVMIAELFDWRVVFQGKPLVLPA